MIWWRAENATSGTVAAIDKSGQISNRWTVPSAEVTGLALRWVWEAASQPFAFVYNSHLVHKHHNNSDDGSTLYVTESASNTIVTLSL